MVSWVEWFSQEYLEAYVAMERRPSQLRSHAYDSVKASEMHVELRSRYLDLECPVAVVHGTVDENVPFEQATRLADDVPRAKLFEVEGADTNSLSIIRISSWMRFFGFAPRDPATVFSSVTR